MRFSTKSQSFSEKKKTKESSIARASNYHLRSEPSNDLELKRVSSNNSHIDEEIKSHAFSMVSVG